MTENRAPRLPPCEDTAPITENWCYSQVNIVRCKYTWVINNFTFCRTESGKVLRSSPFGADANSELSWSLRLHPNGDGEDAAGHVSLYLRLLSGNRSEVKAKYACSIIDARKQKCRASEGKRSRMIQRTNYGWKKFVEIDALDYENNGLLPDDVLTICCEITAFGDIVNVSGVKARAPETGLFDNLAVLLKNAKFADVTLVVLRTRSDSGEKEHQLMEIQAAEEEGETRELRAHKVILAACSPVFAAMFDHDMIEQQRNRVDITDVSDEILQAMLDFMYTGRAVNHEKMAYELLVAADKYAMETLKVICEDTLCASLTIDNAADYLVLADLHGANKLKAQAIEFVNIHTTEVMATAGFKAMVQSHPHLIAEALHVSATRKKIRLSNVF